MADVSRLQFSGWEDRDRRLAAFVRLELGRRR
jgi:hypothetical protein